MIYTREDLVRLLRERGEGFIDTQDDLLLQAAKMLEDEAVEKGELQSLQAELDEAESRREDAQQDCSEMQNRLERAQKACRRLGELSKKLWNTIEDAQAELEWDG